LDLGVTDRVRPLIAAVRAMARDEIMPLEEEYEAEVGRDGDRLKPTARMVEILESLKARARAKSLWNFWLTASDKGYGLTTVEYAYLAEEMGWSPLASEVFDCSAPDTGNMEVLERFGSPEQKARWLPDLLEGRTRSAYLMTEPGVASSDAANIAMDARLDGDEWVLNGEKWWSSGAGDPRCSLYITIALTDPEAGQHGIAESRMSIDMARLLCLKAAWTMDTAGVRAAAPLISQIKVIAPVRRARDDRSGGADAWGRRRQPGFPAGADVDAGANAAPRRRSDAVHRRVIAKAEMKRYMNEAAGR